MAGLEGGRRACGWWGRWLRGGVMAVAIGAASAVVPDARVAAQTSPLTELSGWTFKVHVVVVNSYDGFSWSREATHIDDSITSAASTWAASETGTSVLCHRGLAGSQWSGSGTGVGTFYDRSLGGSTAGWAAYWGLDPTTPWTVVGIRPIGDYPLVTTTRGCTTGGVDTSSTRRGPLAEADIFLPGTWEALNLLRAGTTLAGTYQHVIRETSGQTQTKTITYTATKGSVASGGVREDPVRMYAPLVKLHPEEQHFPMDPSAFLAASRLSWARDDCDDDEGVVGWGQVDPRALAAGQYTHQASVGVGVCFDYGEAYTTAELTAPAQADHPDHATGRREGFYLDLPDELRAGVRPTSTSYDNAPPLFYEYEPGKHIVYWLFYGFNGRAVDKHEGDWEKIVVRLDDKNEATHVAYFQHFCDPFLYQDFPTDEVDYGVFTWAQMQERGYLKDGTHPIVLSAKEAHASYPPIEGRTELLPCEWRGGGYDQVSYDGTWWHTGDESRTFINAATMPWYGFGGGWGDRDSFADASFGWGPLGPGRLVRTVDPAWG